MTENNEHSSYKKLIVWQKSMNFANQVIDVTEQLDTERKHYRLVEQLEASATSVPMNIAEGKGRFSQKEFSHFLMISRGSLYETMTLLEIFKMRKWISEEKFTLLDNLSIEIAKMLNTLYRTIKP
jgi:four helix bundle protein